MLPNQVNLTDPSFGVAVAAISRLKTGHEPPGNQPSMVFAEDFGAQQGLAMLIRGQIEGISGEVARAAATIPAALLPTLMIGGLLLTCP